MAVQGLGQFVADRACTIVDVDGAASQGQIGRMSRRELMGADWDTLRTEDGNEARPLVVFDPDNVNYDVSVPIRAKSQLKYSDLSDNQYGNLDLRQHGASSALRACLMAKERATATLLRTAGNWVVAQNTVGLAGLIGLNPAASGAQFSALGATEFTDLRIAKDLAVDQAGGVEPDALLIGITAWRALMSPTEYAGSGRTTDDRFALPDEELMALIAQRVGVREVIVGRSRFEASAPGIAAAEAYVWGDDCIFLYKGGSIMGGGNGPVLGQPTTCAMIKANKGQGSLETLARDLDATRVVEDEVVLHELPVLVGQQGDGDPATLSLGFLLSNCAP
jgi:hypothetical protein